ncbi:MAG: hypothetical protein FJ033_13220 [Chloroflexi bacterium]|nr:hypothetical protein [Chloroflexota bacterium]
MKRDDDGSLTASGRKAGELAKLITPIPDFYITTKNAGGDPVVDGARWRMVLDGEMNRPVQVDLRRIRALPSVTVAKTLECISNLVTRCEEAPFGCDFISTAEWRGAHFTDVLALAGGLKPNVRSFAIIGADEYSASIPSSSGIMADLVLAYEMNGETLRLEHEYPLRLIIPDRYGYKNAKWVAGIRALNSVHVDWYGARGWSADGIVKTMSRIDVPANGAQMTPGEHRAEGIAYAGARGIRTIEFSADGGATWTPARLVEPPIGRDVWTRWESTFTLRPGQPMELTVRAIDGAGQRQNEQYSLVPPDGQSGRHAITVAPVWPRGSISGPDRSGSTHLVGASLAADGGFWPMASTRSRPSQEAGSGGGRAGTLAASFSAWIAQAAAGATYAKSSLNPMAAARACPKTQFAARVS